MESISDCVFTDSDGWYYFQGRTDESLGFEYGRYYDLTFVCNGKSVRAPFYLDVEQAPNDMQKTEVWIQRYSGYLIIAAAVVVAVLFGWAILSNVSKKDVTKKRA